jgi:hypothetical protein
MEIIVAVICGAIIGFWRGVVSGYHTGVRVKNPVLIYNVEFEEIEGTFLFYEMLTNKFLGQFSNVEDAHKHILADMDENSTLVVTPK